MSETMNEQLLSVEHRSGPECYVRINVTKNTKGYSHETTVSLRWENVADIRMHGSGAFVVRQTSVDGDDLLQVAEGAIADLLRIADTTARTEIVRRQQEDEGRP